ncbi:hypothetical protein [Burkholderia pyrrocinia]|nr:hypothetical protein [Burkholderia pyrrocinia]
MRQISFVTQAEAGKKRKTKREQFRDEMELLVAWSRMMALISRTI